jgi:hypothetical protein
MTNSLKICDMRSEVSTSVIAEIYREILQPSFGPDELDTLDTVQDGLTDGGSYEAWGLCALDGETPVGCMLGYPFLESQVLLIGYVSVKPGLRGGGIGHVMMDAAQQRWYEKPGVALVVAEVEDPRRHPVDGDIDPKRRALFYARRGAQVVVGPYFQPRLEGEGKNRVHHLFLTVLSAARGTISSDNAVSAQMLANFMLDYFHDSGEGEDWPQPDDEEGNQLLSWYRSRTMVPLHPIGDYKEIRIPQTSG